MFKNKKHSWFYFMDQAILHGWLLAQRKTIEY